MVEKFQIFDGFHNHTVYKFVKWDDYAVGERNDLIGTDSVATCLAITLYDPQTGKGALAHISGLYNSPKEFKPERVIDTMLYGLSVRNTDCQRLEATLSGEGLVCDKNLKNSPIVRTNLKDYGIRIIGEDLERGPGRFVFLHCDTGAVEVYRR
jgi:chemotaxis receptor (MCP) glutamine deamidase CheD